MLLLLLCFLLFRSELCDEFSAALLFSVRTARNDLVEASQAAATKMCCNQEEHTVVK